MLPYIRCTSPSVVCSGPKQFFVQVVAEAETIARLANVAAPLVFVLAKFIILLHDKKSPAWRAFDLYAPVAQRSKAERENLKALAMNVRTRLTESHSNVITVDQMVQLCVAWNMNAHGSRRFVLHNAFFPKLLNHVVQAWMLMS